MTSKVVKTENSLKHVRRPDAVTKYKAVEVERSRRKTAILSAVRRLKDSGKRQKVLIVPAGSIKIAKDAMKEVGVSGTLRNISDTYRSYVVAEEA